MASLPARMRRLSEPYSPPPSPTMQALRIGSLHRSPGSDDSHIRSVHPAYTSRKPATTVEHADILDLDDELEDDYEPEPALTSDDATAPSSSRAPSPSLSPVDENAFVDVITSSPQRESFIQSYARSARPSTPITKPDPRDEDVAAVLLSLSFPRVGPSPLVFAVPPPPPRPESPSPQSVLQSHATPAISRIKVEKEASRQSSPHRTSAVEEQLDRQALIDVPTESRVADVPRSPSPVIEIVDSHSDMVQEDILSPLSSPVHQLSPLPPSSPLPETDEEDAADIDAVHENVPSRMSSPLSRLSSIPPSPTMDPEPLPVDFDLPQLELPARDLSLSPELIIMSPLSSPPTSRPSSPIQSEKSRAPSPVQLVRRDVEIVRPVHTKRKHTTPPAESPPRRKRARRIIPDSSPEPESDVESAAAMQVENLAESELDEPEPAPAPAPRHTRGKGSRGARNTARASKPAKGSSKTKPDAPVHIDDRSDKQCPHPALPSVIVEAFALSRATSLPATALYDAICASYPALAGFSASSTRSAAVAEEQGPPTLTQGNVEETLLWGAARGIFELVPSSGDAIPPAFFYIPDADWNKERSGLHSALGGRVARAGKRAYKQYYWKPVVLPRGGGRSSRKRDQEDEVRRGWDVDWEE